MTTLSLDTIAATLEGLEETIIYKLLDRAQFRANTAVYEPGRSGFTGAEKDSLLDLRLRYHESMDAEFGRFCVPEERPFCRDLPVPRRRVSVPDTGLHLSDFETIDCGREIRRAYLALVPVMCRSGDDGQHGSSVEHDVYALQAIARRVHYGALYVGESKYRDAPQRLRALIHARDERGLADLLTRREVEDRVMQRVREKTGTVQAAANRLVRHVIDPEIVVEFYRDTVIPLTKKGEILYLLSRSGDAP